MLNKQLITLFLLLCFSFSAAAQKNKNATKDATSETNKTLDSTIVKQPIDPLAPARVAFYSAVIPGLGQAYNKKYWKIPVVYAALGTGIYFYVDNNKGYKRVRNAYKRRLAGFQDDEFQSRYTDDGLREAQKSFRRNKELSLLITVGLYALNIVDANIDAHLLQYNIDEDLSLKPHYKIDDFTSKGTLGLTLSYSLN